MALRISPEEVIKSWVLTPQTNKMLGYEIRRVQCCMCGRWVSPNTPNKHFEMGDYGTIHSVEFECPPGKGCHREEPLSGE